MPLTAVSAPPPRRCRVMLWPRRTLIAVVVIAALLGTARLLAPGYVRQALNRRLDNIPNYSGRVGEVRLALWRGAYQIRDIAIKKTSGKVDEPLFAADRIDFSITWREIIHGRLVSDIYITNGRLNLLRGPTDESSQLDADHRWQDAINDIFPIQINHLNIQGGVLRFIDTTHTPKVDLAVRNLVVEATGLRNRPDRNGDKFPAKIAISGQTIGNGRLRLTGQMEPLAPQTTFDLALEVREVSLPALNDMLRAYANFDVSKGRLEVFAQMAMRDGRYEGYIKPFLDQLDFQDFDGEKKTLAQRIWKGLVEAAINLAKDRKTKQFATRIPFQGEAGSLDVRTWKSIENAVHHGFVEALPQRFEGTTHPDSPSKLPPDSAISSSVPAKPGD